MKYEEFKERYKDLIFCPLSYEFPDIDMDKLYSWIDNNRDCEYQHYVNGGGAWSYEEYMTNHTTYPLAFFDSYFLLTGKPGKESVWYKDFAEQFPEFVDFVNSMPIIGEPHFGFVKQKSYEEMGKYNVNRVSNLHVDEMNGFGLRMYVNSNKNNMYFYGLKDGDMIDHGHNYPSKNSIERYNKIDSDNNPVFKDGIQLPNDAFYSRRVATNLKTGTRAFFINGIKAAHYVEHEGTDRKLTFLIMGRQPMEERYDWEKISHDIEQLKLVCPEEFIYYDDLCD